MSEKYLIFGATGSIGSSLAEQLKNSGNNIHLVARNENEVSSIAEKLGCTYTVVDVLEDSFIEKVKADVAEIKGIAYCVGSIDLKPLKLASESDFNKCMKLNLYSAIELTSVSFLATRWISFPEFFNCSAKLDPIDPVAPKIRYFSDIKFIISYICL